ncbi:MAG: carboxypeptidase regulatory-like domain-containing protein, partial [Pyrinomonadaceae bacterium]|nr:carboxypeptidase regulatory-like domain-containing protein [Pyrinomonadaceae bacterium]
MLQCRTKSFFQVTFSCLLMLSLFTIVAFAQFRAAVQGSVNDSNGAVVSGATVTLINTETRRTQQTVSNESGFYRFSNLAPGNYTVTAEISNFKKQVLENIDVGAEITQTIDVALETGGINEVVTVESNTTTALETETGNVQKALTAEEIRSLPQSGR